MGADAEPIILIVEDDLGVAELQRRRLERSGFHSRTVTTTEEALAVVSDGGVDLIVLDYRLPGSVNGLEFYAQLKSAGLDVPVIMVTGFSDEATVIRALRTGVRDFVTKSLEYLDYLPEAVGRVLKQDRIEKRLAESEAGLAGIIKSAMDAIITVDGQQMVTLFNPAAERMFGCPANQAVGQHLSRFIPDQFASGGQILPPWQMSEANPTSLRSMGFALRSDGQQFPVEASVSLIHCAARHGCSIVVRDISERKQAEDAIREQATLLDKARDAILVRDLDDRICYWNQGAQRLYGWTASEAMGRSATELLQNRSSQEPLRVSPTTAASDEWSGEVRQVGRDGRELTVESRWSLVRDSEGRPKSYLVINTDITEKKKLEVQFLHAQRMESIGTLAGGVAHEFNNLLQAIRGYTRYAMEGLSTEEQRFQDLDQVIQAADRATALTRDLLSFGRRELLERSLVDPNQIVTSLVKLLRPIMAANIELEVTLTDNLGTIPVDAGQLRQVLMNLCINARDAMPSGGRLSLRTERIVLSADRSLPADLHAGEYLVFTVADNGCGMSAEIQARIFEPFFTTKEVGKGTGLGLAVAYGIVRQHEGVILVSSQPDQGTTFKILLPASDAEETRHIPDVPGRAKGGRELILLAEDEPLVRNLAVRILKDAGYQVLTAGDGAEAVSLFEAQADNVSLVLLDVAMPRLGGYEAYQQIHAIRPETRVLFCSGYDTSTGQAGHLASEGPRLIQKPFDSEELLQAVRETLDADCTCLA